MSDTVILTTVTNKALKIASVHMAECKAVVLLKVSRSKQTDCM